MAKGKTANPADAFRKAQRSRELKKNRDARKSVRDTQLVKKDTRDIESELRSLKNQPKATDTSKARIAELEKELKYVKSVKENYVKEHPEAHDRVWKPYAHKQKLPGQEGEDDGEGEGEGEADRGSGSIYDAEGKLRDPKRSVYYHPVYNPYGVPPPGMPYRERAPEPGDEENEEDDESEEEDSDDEIVMPEGPPPDSDASDSDDSDDVPLPSGPPPPKPMPIPTGPSLNPPLPMRPPVPFGLPVRPMGMGIGFRPPPPQFQPRPPPSFLPHRPPPMVQDPLSDAPTQTYQGYRANQHALPPRPPQSSSALPPGQVSTTGAGSEAGTISAAPQLRDLRKEATAFVPRGVKRKKVVGGVTTAVVNAAPGAGDVDEEGDEVRRKGPGEGGSGGGLLGKLQGVLGDFRDDVGGGGAVDKAGKGNTDDDYQNFLAGLNDMA